MSKLERLAKSTFCRLMVEGSDDLHSVIALMRRHGIDYDIVHEGMPYINDCNGVDNLLANIGNAVKTYQRVGFMLDADLSIEDRWMSVRDRLITNGVPTVPETLPQEGLVIPGRRPDSLVGVWLMPDNEEPGILENFLEKLISGDDPCWSHAHEATVRAGEIGAPFQNYIKARLHTWLAWREPPGQPFGTAMTARCFQSDTDDALRFVDWFRRIFPESTPPAPASESITSEETPQLSES